MQKVGQNEIIKCLKNSKEPLSSKQIAEALDISNTRVCYLLSRLLKYHEIKFIELSYKEARKLFNYNVSRRLRFYYI